MDFEINVFLVSIFVPMSDLHCFLKILFDYFEKFDCFDFPLLFESQKIVVCYEKCLIVFFFKMMSYFAWS